MRKLIIICLALLLLIPSMAHARRDWQSASLQDGEYMNNGYWRCHYRTIVGDYRFSIKHKGTACPFTVYKDMDTDEVRTKSTDLD